MNLRHLIAFALAAACGSSGNPALSRTFNYAAPQAASTSEQSAATSAQSAVSNSASFSAAPDATRGMAMAGFALDLAGEALGSATFGAAKPDTLRGALRRASLDTCATVAGNTVTFKDCTDGESGFDVSLNGSITATAGNVTWGITATFSASDTYGSASIAMHHAGTLSVTDTKVTGNATSDFSGSFSGQGQSVGFGFAVAVLLDLSYQTAPTACVTAGSAEVRRVWTQRPQGATGAAFSDAGVKFDWTACGAVQVQHST